MISMAFAGALSMFGDQVYSSTDLNRRHSEVLNRARKAPVTISRNNEQFALMNRDQAASLVKAVASMGETLELLHGALNVVKGDEVSTSISWLKAFSKEDLAQFIDELMPAAEKAFNGSESWDSVETIIHEWHESALAIQSGVLEEALSAERDEVPLADPRQLIEEESIELAAAGAR